MATSTRSVGLVTASYNTRELTALLLWSLYRVLDHAVDTVVVVDNASTDGSRELLSLAREAGICTLITNDANVGHGPALNQGIDVLVEQATVEWIWVLDSDCVIARPDALDAVEANVGPRAPAIIGEAHWDRWLNRHRFTLSSLIIDPTQLRDHALPGFNAGGDPSIDLLDGAERHGLLSIAFPFTADGHVIHRGRGSLAGIAARHEESHPLYEWARDHHEPHFGGVPGADRRYDDLVSRFRADCGADLDNFVDAVIRS